MEYTMSPVSEAPQAAEKSTVIYAGFWRRFLAYVLDTLLLGAVYMILSLGFGVGFLGAAANNEPNAAGAAMASMFFLYFLVLGVGGWLYFALMESSKNRATLGKMALGLHVTDLSGQRISFGRATGRYFSKLISGAILGIGYIMAGFTAKKQALHDMIANTLVLSKQAEVPASVAQNAFVAS